MLRETQKERNIEFKKLRHYQLTCIQTVYKIDKPRISPTAQTKLYPHFPLITIIKHVEFSTVKFHFQPLAAISSYKYRFRP
jgi:hypothetical protein